MTTNDPRTEALEHDLEDVFAVPVPPTEFRIPKAAAFPSVPSRRRRKFAGVAAIAAAVLGAVLIVPAFGTSGPKVASAQELIERSMAAADALATNPANYHMVSVSHSSGWEMSTESWLGGPNRYRVESVTRFDTGDTTVDGTAMVNGEMWLWQGAAAAPVVAHGPAAFSVQPPPRSISVAQHLEGWNDNNCFKAEVTGTESIAGRKAHVISVVATPENCLVEPKPLRLATILIDIETELPLKMVYTSDKPAGGSSFEVTKFETFTSLKDSAFIYSAPAGTKVLEFNDAAELKRLLSNVIVYTVPMGSVVKLDALPQPGSQPADTGP